MAKLRGELAADGRGERFEALKTTLAGEERAVPYAEIGRQLGMSEGAVKVAAHRLRRRCRELLRAEIMQTVSERSALDEELRYLFAVLAA